VVRGALWWLSLVFLRSWFQWYGQGFNGIGIAFALLSWIYVISIVWVLTVAIAAVLWERSAAREAGGDREGDREVVADVAPHATSDSSSQLDGP
jgi:hypothetical protein